MKVLKSIGKWFLIIFVVLNLAIIVFGKTYLYKGIANTYIKGRTGPAIDEYKIFANREVKAGTPHEWPVSKADNTHKISDEHLKQFTEMQTIAFLVIKNDSIIHEQYWDGFGEDSHTNSFSMAKTFISMLVGAAIDDEKIKSIDQPIGDFLPEYKDGDNAKITIRHLLTMSSGIDFNENYVNPFAYPAEALFTSDLKKLTYKSQAKEVPGKNFKYLSGNTELLGFIIEKATGKKVGDYFSEKIWSRIGAKQNAYWSLDHEDGMEKAFCCFNSNARDFARLGKLYLDSGRYNGNQIIAQDYVLNSIKPAHLIDEDGNKNQKYGYSWWLVPGYKGHDIFYARGILGQYIICIPDKKMIVVRLGKKREKRKDSNHPTDMYYYLDAALEMYGN